MVGDESIPRISNGTSQDILLLTSCMKLSTLVTTITLDALVLFDGYAVQQGFRIECPRPGQKIRTGDTHQCQKSNGSVNCFLCRSTIRWQRFEHRSLGRIYKCTRSSGEVTAESCVLSPEIQLSGLAVILSTAS
jgi:hypothetical protein